MNKSLLVALVTTAALAGCSTVPIGPSVTVMPTKGKPFDLFLREDAECRGYARQSIGTDPQDAQTRAFAASAATGAVVGAAVGALSHNAGSGAAVGLGAGSLFGFGSAENSRYALQQRYDITYQQCMYAKGNEVMPRTSVRYYHPAYYYP